MKTFATHLLEFRNRQKLSQSELAEIMDCTQQTVSLYERERSEPSFSKGCQILSELGIRELRLI